MWEQACLLACIINLLMAPVANVLMRLGYQGKGTKNFSKQRDFFKLGNYHCEKAYMLYVKTSNVILLPADV